ncbi:MAG TPA: TonB family protein [Gammaproteobacteria bacterium]|nr:TonB family protein [Gammaproteobacteria bacterium]
MSCNDVASILDNHHSTRLTPAERARVDEHLLACSDCAAAWRAQDDLLALRVPPMPAALLERALLASRLPQSAPARRARLPVIIGSALLAGAAAAAVTVSMMREQPVTPTASSPPVEQSDTPATPTAVSERVVEVETAPAAPQGDGVTSVELVEVALGVQPVVRKSPDYPPDALKAGIEGHVKLKFDVTVAGLVENINVIESSGAQFEDPAARALAQWRYLPRIEAGKRVGSQGIQTVIRFALNRDPAAVAVRTVRPDNDYVAFNEGLAVAMDRLAADDLRGVELQLDEMQALYGADRANLWNFYGYLYTVEGNYGRAIDAYERSVAIATQPPAPVSVPYVPLANLYFARHQYDLALKTLLRPNLPGGNRLVTPEANALLEKLNALGVTEETVR